MPRVSLGMPVYNGEPYLIHALEVILAQTFSDFELIISDNASTDNTEEICRTYAARDSRVTYFRNQENLGAARNYNIVFERSQGEYFKWVSHDDSIAPTYLEQCVDVLSAHPDVVLCYPGTIVIDKHGNRLPTDPGDNITAVGSTPRERLRDFLISSSRNRKCNAVFGLIRSRVLAQTPLIGAYPSSDKNLLAELALHGSFLRVKDPLFFRRDHPESSVNANPGLEERAAWFDPRKKGAVRFQHWSWLSEYFSAIRRVPMSVSQRVLCSFEMLRWVKRERKKLTGELKTVVHHSWSPDGTGA